MPVTAIESYKQFQEIINGARPVVIDFWAPWCGPCKMISPTFETMSNNERFGQIGFYKVDADAQMAIAQEVGIRAMPTFVLFKSGAKIDEVTGAHTPSLENLLNSA